MQTGGLDTGSCRVLGILSKGDRGAVSQVASQGGSQHEQRYREAREQVCGNEQVRPQSTAVVVQAWSRQGCRSVGGKGGVC